MTDKQIGTSQERTQKEVDVKQSSQIERQTKSRKVDHHSEQQNSSEFLIEEEPSRKRIRSAKRKIPVSEDWKNQDVKRIFRYYEEYGTHWSLLQRNFDGKSQNSIKNKFYGILKNLLRCLFREQGNFPGKKLRNLSANTITDVYDGRKEFKKYKGLLKKLLESMEFQINRKKVIEFLEIDGPKVAELYESIFGQKCKNPGAEHTQHATEQHTLMQGKIISGHQIVENQISVPTMTAICQPPSNLYSFPYFPQVFYPQFMSPSIYFNQFFQM